jgi:hypothetical protein
MHSEDGLWHSSKWRKKKNTMNNEKWIMNNEQWKMENDEIIWYTIATFINLQ